MAGRFSVEAVFRAVDKVTAPVTRMQNRVGKMSRSMERGFRRANRAFKGLVSGIKRGARVAAISIGLLGLAANNVLGAGAEFEQAITNVGAVSLKTRDQIALLEKQALKLGATTKFTATEAAGAMEVLARAGFNQQQILQATPAILSAAAASSLEIAEVANHVSNVLKGMRLEMSDAGRVADVLALASSKTNSSIGSLGESMKNVASTARQLNVPLEDTVAAVALLQDVGLDASVAGSAFNTMLTKMAAPSRSLSAKMRKLGISFKDANGDMLPLSDVLEQLSIASKKVGGNFDQVAFLAELVGLRGQKAAANLSQLFETGRIEELTKALRNAGGSAEKMAAIRMNTTQGSMLLLGSAIDAVKVKIFDMNRGPLKGLVDRMADWVSINGELIASKIGGFLGMLITNLPTIVSSLADIGKGIAAVLALTIAFQAVSAILGVINLLMAANPIVLGILAAVAAVALLSGALDPVLDVIKNIGANIGKLFTGLKDFGIALGFGDENGPALPAFPGPQAEGGQGAAGTLDAAGTAGPQVVSPADRVARSIEEQRTTSTAEVTIRDETGRAEVTGGKLGRGVKLQPTGGM